MPRNSSTEISVETYAKVNLTLEVLGRRSDGYHNIETIFQNIDLHDTLRIKKQGSGGLKLHVEAPPVSARGAEATVSKDRAEAMQAESQKEFARLSRENVIAKVYDLLQGYVKNLPGIEIRLTKVIPMASGLGGASANAAGAILGIDRLLMLDLPKSNLWKIASTVGSDVPFFLIGGTARGSSRGDVVTPIEHQLSYYLLLMVPCERVSTREAYQSLAKKDFSKRGIRTDRTEQALRENHLEEVCDAIHNTFLLKHLAEHKECEEVLNEIEKTSPDAVGLSGTGPALFAIYRNAPSRKVLLDLERALRPKIRLFHLTRPVDRAILIHR